VQESITSQTDSTAKKYVSHRPVIVWTGRIGGVLFGLSLAWLLAEILLRVFFFSLPPRLQLVLNHVHVTPFTDTKLMPDPIWESDIDYLTKTRAVQDREQFGSAEVRFIVNTESLWGSRVAFRTRQEQVNFHVDAIAVGDSFTFCFTDEDQCWVQRLGALTQRNIINLGIVSTGSVSHRLVLGTFGMQLKPPPPLVIWQWFGNDANEDYGLALLRGETDIESPNPPPPVPEYNWLDKNSAVYAALKLAFGSDNQYEAELQFLDREQAKEDDVELHFGQPYLWGAFDMDQPHNQYGWERSKEAFREASAMVESYGGTLVIILMPTKEQVYREMSEPLLGSEKIELLDKSRQMMLDFCEQENLTCIDLLPTFQKGAAQGEQLYYTTDMHLNPHGNEVLAQMLAAWLDEHPEIFENTP
jgi:hypothetical protein